MKAKLQPELRNEMLLAVVMPDAMMHHQLELEKLYSNNQTIKRIKQEFVSCKDFKFTEYMETRDIPIDFGYDLLIQMVLHKRTTMSTLVGILRTHFLTVQETADHIVRAAYHGLVNYNPNAKQFVVVFDINKHVQDDLDRYQYPLPMVVEPKEVKTNRDTGYYLSTNSIILRKNHHDDDTCLDHINRVNRIAFSINHDTAHMIKNKWKNLDHAKPRETQADYMKRVKAFQKYDRNSKDVIALVLQHGNKIFLTHKYDKRGRTYCQGYHVNYQGAPWNKAVIELYDKELVT